MSITLDLPEKTENALIEEAKAKQQDLESIIIEYLNDKVGNEVNETLDFDKMLKKVEQTLEEVKKRPKTDLVSMVGSGRHCSSFKTGTTEEIDAYVRNLRDEWKY